MANYFAIKSGNWDDTTVWDSGIIPTSADVVYTNGFTVTINSDLDVNQLRNGSNNGQLPNMIVPRMTSNTAPSGVASASANNTTAFNAFNDIGWYPGTSIFTLQYDFPSPVIIKKYRVVSYYNNAPKTWTFQGYNTATSTWDNLDTVTTSVNATICYISSILANPTAYSSYRLNVTAIWANPVVIYGFDMTQSSAVTNGSGVAPTTLIATGGNYLVSALPTAPSTRTITLRNTLTGILCQSPQLMINITATTGILNINHATLGNLIGGSDAGWQNSLPLISTATSFIGTLNINGNIIGQTSFWQVRDCAGVLLNGSCTLNVVGNLIAGGGIASGCNPINLATTASLAVVNVTGNLIGQQVNLNTPGSCAIYSASTGASTINITGNITGGVFSGIYCLSTSNTSINIITGTVTASNTTQGITNLGGGLVTLFSPIINANNVVGLMSQRVRFYQTGVSQWRFQNQAGANVTIYSGTGGGMGYPEVDTVRYGSPAYGASGEFSGTMRIPDVTNVNKGVEYGYLETGTAVLTAEDFLNAISTSSNPVAVRLKNVSTVNTTGDQLAAFNN